MIGPKRWRGLAFASAVLLAVTANAATEIHSLTGAIEGHQVGGVTIDLIGNVYVADFADEVWKIAPEGDRQLFATGLYGASGNVIDNDGSLLQSSYYGDTITRIDRNGNAKPFVTAGGGLSGPVGLASTLAVDLMTCRPSGHRPMLRHHPARSWSQPSTISAPVRSKRFLSSFVESCARRCWKRALRPEPPSRPTTHQTTSLACPYARTRTYSSGLLLTPATLRTWSRPRGCPSPVPGESCVQDWPVT